MHSLISVLQKILMTFMNIYNGLGGVNEQRFYVLTDTPNYDIDITIPKEIYRID